MSLAVIDRHKDDVNFDQLDEVIQKHVPSGFKIRNQKHQFANLVNIADVQAPINRGRAERSIGTLGGGNHFIELNEWDDKVAIVIHSGSRNLGKQIAEYYQDLAYQELMEMKDIKQEVIDQLKQEGRVNEIQETLNSMKSLKIQKALAYLEGDSFRAYMHDMAIAQKYADLNRKAMIEEIVRHMEWQIIDEFTTIHNYIDIENMILRKGAISAQKGERVIVPMNMRDGSLIAEGKGNPDWNYSAPHGAGRLMSRSKAKANLSLHEFQLTMKEIWSTSVVSETLDESPMAYKPMEEIITNTENALSIQKIIKPLYNYKAH
ncbi:RtcB family protein [Bacillus sp. CLL-7-23]|uniref:3'-phosphate/5'-hydroxy nucleic acid ligase n=1 Tax=Bacillus changyiensis TaxID=3004103 RepID=A0ABT4X5C0_9BACI|nr:RtcB family protein [Bacillus changyiensis]MDA7027483.1 RtcB family protein [Bacillus changyiensis]